MFYNKTIVSSVGLQVWDYQTKACVQTLEGHGHNISAVAFHPELPIILTGSEDGTVRMWHSTTYRCAGGAICYAFASRNIRCSAAAVPDTMLLPYCYSNQHARVFATPDIMLLR